MISKKKLTSIMVIVVLLASGCHGIVSASQPGSLIKPPVNSYASSQVNQKVLAAVNKHLPKRARLVNPSEPKGSKAVQAIDMNGDGKDEIVAVYRTVEPDGNYGVVGLMVLSDEHSGYKKLINYKSEGYKVAFVKKAAITGKDKKDLVVAWSIGASIGNGIDVFTMKNDKIKKIAGFYANKVYIEDMPDAKGQKDGIDEIAFWQHDTGEAYVTDVVRWNGEKLASVPEVYPYYYKTVVPYYQQKVKEMPSAAFYWYYLADAQLKAGSYKDSLESVKKGMAILKEYPDYYPEIKKYQKIEAEATKLLNQ
jgi:hypothetical protein